MKLYITSLFNSLKYELDGGEASCLAEELWLCLHKSSVLLCPFSLVIVIHFKFKNLSLKKCLLSCHSFLEAFCRMAQMVSVLLKVFSDPAHLGASWAVTPEAGVEENGCGIGRWGDHQLPEQSTFGPKKSRGSMAALPQQPVVTCTRVAGLFLFCVASPVSLLSAPSSVCPLFGNTDAPACRVIREQNWQNHINLFFLGLTFFSFVWKWASWPGPAQATR